MNNLPNFENEPECPPIEIDFDKPRPKLLYECVLPPVVDLDAEDEPSIALKTILKNYMEFEKKTMTISIDLTKINEHDVGIKIIEFTMSDDKEEIVRSVNIMILKK